MRLCCCGRQLVVVVSLLVFVAVSGGAFGYAGSRLTAAGNPYVVNGSFIVDGNLSLGPGVEFVVGEGAGIVVGEGAALWGPSSYYVTLRCGGGCSRPPLIVVRGGKLVLPALYAPDGLRLVAVDSYVVIGGYVEGLTVLEARNSTIVLRGLTSGRIVFSPSNGSKAVDSSRVVLENVSSRRLVVGTPGLGTALSGSVLRLLDSRVWEVEVTGKSAAKNSHIGVEGSVIGELVLDARGLLSTQFGDRVLYGSVLRVNSSVVGSIVIGRGDGQRYITLDNSVVEIVNTTTRRIVVGDSLEYSRLSKISIEHTSLPESLGIVFYALDSSVTVSIHDSCLYSPKYSEVKIVDVHGTLRLHAEKNWWGPNGFQKGNVRHEGTGSVEVEAEPFYRDKPSWCADAIEPVVVLYTIPPTPVAGLPVTVAADMSFDPDNGPVSVDIIVNGTAVGEKLVVQKARNMSIAVSVLSSDGGVMTVTREVRALPRPAAITLSVNPSRVRLGDAVHVYVKAVDAYTGDALNGTVVVSMGAREVVVPLNSTGEGEGVLVVDSGAPGALEVSAVYYGPGLYVSTQVQALVYLEDYGVDVSVKDFDRIAPGRLQPVTLELVPRNIREAKASLTLYILTDDGWTPIGSTELVVGSRPVTVAVPVRAPESLLAGKGKVKVEVRVGSKSIVLLRDVEVEKVTSIKVWGVLEPRRVRVGDRLQVRWRVESGSNHPASILLYLRMQGLSILLANISLDPFSSANSTSIVLVNASMGVGVYNASLVAVCCGREWQSSLGTLKIAPPLVRIESASPASLPVIPGEKGAVRVKVCGGPVHGRIVVRSASAVLGSSEIALEKGGSCIERMVPFRVPAGWDYRAAVVLEVAGVDVDVREVVFPHVELSVTPQETSVLPGEKVEFTVSLDFEPGNTSCSPPPFSKLTATLTSNGSIVFRRDVTVGGEASEARIAFRVEEPGRYVLRVTYPGSSCYPPAGSEAVLLVGSYSLAIAGLEYWPRVVTPGSNVSVAVAVNAANVAGINATVSVQLASPEGTVVSTATRTVVLENGLNRVEAAVGIPSVKPGEYLLQVRVLGPGGVEARATGRITVSTIAASLEAPETVYAGGMIPLRLTIRNLSPYPEKLHVQVFFEGSSTEDLVEISGFANTTRLYELPVPPRIGAVARAVAVVRYEDVNASINASSEPVEIAAPNITVKAVPPPAPLYPGANTSIGVEVCYQLGLYRRTLKILLIDNYGSERASAQVVVEPGSCNTTTLLVEAGDWLNPPGCECEIVAVDSQHENLVYSSTQLFLPYVKPVVRVTPNTTYIGGSVTVAFMLIGRPLEGTIAVRLTDGIHTKEYQGSFNGTTTMVVPIDRYKPGSVRLDIAFVDETGRVRVEEATWIKVVEPTVSIEVPSIEVAPGETASIPVSLSVERVCNATIRTEAVLVVPTVSGGEERVEASRILEVSTGRCRASGTVTLNLKVPREALAGSYRAVVKAVVLPPARDVEDSLYEAEKEFTVYVKPVPVASLSLGWEEKTLPVNTGAELGVAVENRGNIGLDLAVKLLGTNNSVIDEKELSIPVTGKANVELSIPAYRLPPGNWELRVVVEDKRFGVLAEKRVRVRSLLIPVLEVEAEPQDKNVVVLGDAIQLPVKLRIDNRLPLRYPVSLVVEAHTACGEDTSYDLGRVLLAPLSSLEKTVTIPVKCFSGELKASVYVYNTTGLERPVATEEFEVNVTSIVVSLIARHSSIDILEAGTRGVIVADTEGKANITVRYCAHGIPAKLREAIKIEYSIEKGQAGIKEVEARSEKACTTRKLRILLHSDYAVLSIGAVYQGTEIIAKEVTVHTPARMHAPLTLTIKPIAGNFYTAHIEAGKPSEARGEVKVLIEAINATIMYEGATRGRLLALPAPLNTNITLVADNDNTRPLLRVSIVVEEENGVRILVNSTEAKAPPPMVEAGERETGGSGILGVLRANIHIVALLAIAAAAAVLLYLYYLRDNF